MGDGWRFHCHGDHGFSRCRGEILGLRNLAVILPVQNVLGKKAVFDFRLFPRETMAVISMKLPWEYMIHLMQKSIQSSLPSSLLQSVLGAMKIEQPQQPEGLHMKWFDSRRFAAWNRVSNNALASIISPPPTATISSNYSLSETPVSESLVCFSDLPMTPTQNPTFPPLVLIS